MNADTKIPTTAEIRAAARRREIAFDRARVARQHWYESLDGCHQIASDALHEIALEADAEWHAAARAQTRMLRIVRAAIQNGTIR